MNPHKMNKVDISTMSEQDQKAFKMYGKMPAKNMLTKMQKDRRYFDSGDYMMNKAGVGNAQPLGTAIPTPEGVPHASPPGPNSPGILASGQNSNIPTPSPGAEQTNPLAMAGSPTKRETSPISHTQASPIGVPGANAQAGGQTSPKAGGVHPSLANHRGSVGVGISPAVTNDAVDVPAHTHIRRSSESHGARISPPATLRNESTNPSSFPIQHHGIMGSSPVKASGLARRLDEEMEG